MENSSNLPQKQFTDLTLDEAMEHEMKDVCLLNDPNIDLKKIRRNVSNRLSAQRSRTRMVNHTLDMENMVKDLESLTSILTTQVESYTEKKKVLQLENDSLQQKFEKLSNESRSQEMEIEEKRADIKMLKELEKAAQKNKHAADSEAEQIPADFCFEQLKVAKYPSVDFYQQLCLQNQQETSSSAVVPNMAPDSAIERSGELIRPAKIHQPRKRSATCRSLKMWTSTSTLMLWMLLILLLVK